MSNNLGYIGQGKRFSYIDADDITTTSLTVSDDLKTTDNLTVGGDATVTGTITADTIRANTEFQGDRLESVSGALTIVSTTQGNVSVNNQLSEVLIRDTGVIDVRNNSGGVRFDNSASDAIIVTLMNEPVNAGGTGPLTIEGVNGGMITVEPLGGVSYAMPSASALVAELSDTVREDDTHDFALINILAGGGDIATVTTTTTVGSMDVGPSSSGMFRIRYTDVSSGTEAFTLYRIS